ncbi:Dedicator of cytokinesis protein 9 [Eumeta japonica]|uniref:Dedicator of cytokinesis protein 9 n=1 Tax=Eumeta variegata TaxID=151549 RepID=A0A4C1XBK6_EUMVA|nr:Dedicator of cytokinesis protein 9 [Eumeta japonica]
MLQDEPNPTKVIYARSTLNSGHKLYGQGRITSVGPASRKLKKSEIENRTSIRIECMSDIHYNEQALLEQLMICTEYVEKSERYELLGPLYRLIVPMHERRKDYQALLSCYQHLTKAYAKVIEVTQSGKRLLGRFYRVAFYGKTHFSEDEEGKEFIYKEPKLTSLSEISEKLQTFYEQKFGAGNVKMIMDSAPVSKPTLSPLRVSFERFCQLIWVRREELDPKLAYIQVTWVRALPDNGSGGPACPTGGEGSFERAHNVRRFVYETPFTRDGAARGPVHHQRLRLTHLTAESWFPYVKRRSPVIDKQEEEKSPIEVALSEMEAQVAELTEVVNAKVHDIKKLQLRNRKLSRLKAACDNRSCELRHVKEGEPIKFCYSGGPLNPRGPGLKPKKPYGRSGPDSRPIFAHSSNDELSTGTWQSQHSLIIYLLLSPSLIYSNIKEPLKGLQGSVCVQVNAGPLAYANAFLDPALCHMYPDEAVDKLKAIFNGFVPNCLLAFKSTKTTEYHEEMNYEKFKDWFIGLLNNLKEPVAIIMDNAPYHSVQVDKPPNQSNRKSELVKWLSENGVTADITMLKTELIALVRRHKPPTPTYALDEMAKGKGHQVLRLPPYHCQYNAIELIWAQIKGHAARNNTSPPFTANSMLALLQEAINNVQPEDCSKVVNKTERDIMSDWDRDIHIDNIMESSLIISVTDSDDEFSENSDV